MKDTSKVGGIAVVAGVLILVACSFFFVFWPNLVRSSIPLKLGSGAFKADIAINNVQRTSGLSGVKEMASDKALIMAYPYESRWKIWMKDMFIPIDIVWLNNDKKVVYIVKNAMPAGSTSKVFEPKSLAKYVIEMPAGTINSKSIDIGQIAEFEIKEADIR